MRQNNQQYEHQNESEAILWPCVIGERAKLANINPRCTKGRASIKETTFPIRFQGDAWCFWNFLYLITHTTKQKYVKICFKNTYIFERGDKRLTLGRVGFFSLNLIMCFLSNCNQNNNDYSPNDNEIHIVTNLYLVWCRFHFTVYDTFWGCLCFFLCLFKWFARPNALSHWLHLYSFSPVCVIKCNFKYSAREEA